jgi:hypothetical protein
MPVRGGVDDLGLGPGETTAIALALETHADRRYGGDSVLSATCRRPHVNVSNMTCGSNTTTADRCRRSSSNSWPA